MELLVQLFCHRISPQDNEFTQLRKQIRQQEYNFCFLRNLNHPFVSKIHIFLENPDDMHYYLRLADQSASKLHFIPFGSQPHYKDFIEYAQKNIPDNTLICIQNGDILLDNSLPLALIQDHVQGMTMFGLTRHEFTDEEHSTCNLETCNLIHNYWGSADTFILRTPLSKEIALDNINFKQNLFGAENVFQKYLQQAGYTIRNPCYQIRIFHVHQHRAYFHTYETIGNHLDFNEPPSYLSPLANEVP
jgi:hypothetical protein